MATYGANNPNDTVPISSLQPNSHKYHQSNAKKPERPKMEKVVKNGVNTRKRSLGKKFAETFLADDIQDVRGYIFFDVFVPMVKDLLYNSVMGSIGMMLYGSANKHFRNGGGLNERNSYTAYYKSGTRSDRRNDAVNRNSRIDYRDIVLDSRNEAEEVLSQLIDLTTDYEAATLADLYDLVGITRAANFQDEKWGWTNLEGARVRIVHGGKYLLELPQPQPLDL